MQRFKTHRLWLIIGLGVVPFTPLPMAVQVGLAVGIVVLLMALSAVARNPGAQKGGPHPAPRHGTREAQGPGIGSGIGASDAAWLALPLAAQAHAAEPQAAKSEPDAPQDPHGLGGGAADSGMAADSWSSGDSGGGGAE